MQQKSWKSRDKIYTKDNIEYGFCYGKGENP